MLIAYIVVEVIIVIIMGQTVYYNKQAQLTLESESASNSLAGFFEKIRESDTDVGVKSADSVGFIGDKGGR